MSSSLRVNTIVPSTGTNVAIGTANGTVTFTDSVNFVLGTGSSIFSPASNTLTFGTNDAERLRITSAGYLGLGTNNPSYLIDAHTSSGNAQLRVKSGGDLSQLILESTDTSGYSQINFADAGSNNIGMLQYFHSDNHMEFTVNGAERVRIDNSGRLGLGVVPEAFHSNNKAVIRGDSGYTILGRGDNSLNISQNFYYDSSDAGKYIANGEASLYNQSDGQHVFYSAVSGSANASASMVEKLRIRAAGPHLLIGTGGDATYNEITESSSNAGLVIGSSSMGNGGIVIRNSTSGTGRIYFADNSGNDPGRQRGQINYYHNGDYMMFATAGSERVRILSNGLVNIGGYLSSVSNCGLHVGRSSGGTAAGESVLAASLGNDSTMVSALLTVKNAGNRGAQGASGGSPLAKFQFNNGTAFEIDKYGRRTLPYQPAFSVRRNGGQDIPHNTNTKVQWNTEIFDVGGHFDSSTNYRFTAPLSGKYLFMGHLYVYPTYQVEAKIYKNGSIYKRFSGPLGTGGNDNPNGADFMDIVSLSVNDYIEIFALQSRTGDTSTQTIYGGNEKETSFVGYFLG